jgi:hypothetical protein
MLRGGAKPVADSPVTLPPTTLELEVEASSSSCLPALDDLADTDSGSSSDETGMDDGSPELTVQVVQAKSADCIFLLNSSSMVAHVAACCEPDDSLCVIKVQDGDITRALDLHATFDVLHLMGRLYRPRFFPQSTNSV